MDPCSWMLNRNPLILHTFDNDRHFFWEDLKDADGRCYRIEFSCDANGRNANAVCLHNPWGDNPFEYTESHLAPDGFICIGRQVGRGRSRYTLDYAVIQVLAWVNGYSHFREHGWRATVRALPAWAG